MKVGERRAQEARAKAEKSFSQSQQRENAFRKERDRIRVINDEKTTRLRNLRLAKEAAEREAALIAAANAPPKPPKKTKSKKAAEPVTGE